MTEGVSRAIVICSRCEQRSPQGMSWEETLDWYATHEPCMKSPTSPQESFVFDAPSVSDPKVLYTNSDFTLLTPLYVVVYFDSMES